ncbi:MAG: beta-glucosidase, partial [Actinomycetota bacterium]
VATTVKHFVGNDAEFERMTIDSVIDERTLREVYLVPFELAVREGGSLGIMTSYNRLNGRYNAENRWLLDDLLRGEWGFEGFVITDWYAGFTTEGAAEAGLDLEMPAPARYYGKHLLDAVKEGRVDESQVDRAVRTLLTVFDRLGALDDQPAEPTAVDLHDHRVLVRRASAASMVLLRNETIDGAPLLPLDSGALRRLAVIGPNAARARIMGGGSAEVMPHPHLTIIEALRSRFAGAEVIHEHGCSIDRSTPTIAGDMITSPNGEPGFTVTIVDNGRDIATIQRPDGRVLVVARQEEGVPVSGFRFTAVGHLEVDATGEHTISLSETSPCRLFLDDECIIDGTELPPPGHRFFGLFREEIATTVRLTKGRTHVLRL